MAPEIVKGGSGGHGMVTSILFRFHSKAVFFTIVLTT